MTERTVPVHDLLLALAGRLDDDLLAWARELLAVGEQDQAVELATAALAAEGVALPASLRDGLVAAARAARTDLDVDRAMRPAATEPGTAHRFDAAAAPGHAVAAALTALPARRLAGCRLHLTWRRTPAGAVPGPLPRAVVLVEADQDRSAEVLAYLLATELERAGAAASVEVFTTGAALPAYHVAALREAREVVVTGRATSPDPAGPSGEPSRPTGRRRRPEPAAPDESGVTRAPDGPSEGDGPAAGSTADGGGAPDAGDATGSPPPDRAGALREMPPVPERAAPDRSGPELFMPDGFGPDLPGRAVPELFGRDRPGPDRSQPGSSGPGRSGADRSGRERPGPDLPGRDRPGPDLGPDTDPFYGPLRVPLLAPLLDPTADVDDAPAAPDVRRPDPTGSDGIAPAPSDHGPRDGDTEHAAPAEPGSAPATPGPASPGPDTPGPPTPGPDTPGPRDPGASGPADVPAEWEREWRTGEWAIPHPPPAAPDASGSAGRHDAAETLGSPAAGEPHLPRRPDRAEGRRRDAGTRRVDGVGGGRTPAAADDVSLFESPTARVAPSAVPGRTTATGGHPAAPAPHGPTSDRPTPDRPTPHRPASPGSPPPGSTPQGSPAPGSAPPGSPSGSAAGRRSDEPGRVREDLGGAALFSPRQPDAPLFGSPPRPDNPFPRPDGRPTGAATEAPRTGRRRRPDEPTPGTAAPSAGSPPTGPPAGGPTPGAPDGSEGPPDAEPSSLLSGTERDLLSQLQADLTRERRPRPYRRAGRNGSAQPVNGHGPDGDRPDG